MKRVVLLLLISDILFGAYSQEIDSIIDIRDGQIYKIVKIGGQWWLQENLNTGIMIDSLQNASDNKIIEKYCYSNSTVLCDIYGGLYQWNEMMDYNPSINGDSITNRGICPFFWHLPDDPEWTALVNYIGGYSMGGKLKEAGTSHWADPNRGGDNESGFTALPGGYLDNSGTFHDLGKIARLWSSTEYDMSNAWCRELNYNLGAIKNLYGGKNNAFSVRCIRDTVLYAHLMITDKSFNIISKLEFSDNRLIDTIILINSGAGKAISITSMYANSPAFIPERSSSVLSPGDSIHLRITFDPQGKWIHYTDTLHIESDDPYIPEIFIPLSGYSEGTDSIVDIRDGQVYGIIKIGGQFWMQENLNTGTRIDSSQNPGDNGLIEKYCYSDNINNCQIYGGLYQWNEMMDYHPSDTGNPGTTQGICPVEWHVPTEKEWTEMANYLGGNDIAGGKLKETGTFHWYSPNTGANNESGFTALPAGWRNRNQRFSYQGYRAYFWSSTQTDASKAIYRLLMYDNSTISVIVPLEKNFGFSIRCVRDSGQYKYLTIFDVNLKPVPALNFYGANITKELIIINSGAGKTINISSIHTTGSGYDLSKSSSVLPPGDSIHLNVSFSPPVKNIYPDTLYIISDDPYNPLIEIPLFGTFPLEIAFTEINNISCHGDSTGSITVTPSLGTPPYLCQWDDNDYTTNFTMTGLKANVWYKVRITDSMEESVTDSILLIQPDEKLKLNPEFTDTICSYSKNGSVKLNPSGGTPGYLYEWSNGETSQNLSDLYAGDYSVKVTDSQGCKDSMDFTIDSILPFDGEKICVVTVDLSSGKNLCVWEKSSDKGIAFYRIYRENTSIGTIPYDNLSVFEDITADPEERPYLYYLAAVDTCDNESARSPFHKPLFLQYISSENGVHLLWSKYEIEGEILNFDSYSIYRGSDSTALSLLVENIPTEINVYTDKDPGALLRRYYYRVAGVLTNPCYPTAGTTGKKVDSGPYSQSMSNIEDNRLEVGIEETFKSHPSVRIVPNPLTESASLFFSNPDGSPYQLCIMDLSGKVCRIVNHITASEYLLEKGDLKQGFYFIELRGLKTFRAKIVIE